eukprot:TRINITY_DN29863_c0_g1_i2.p1 TRINITY_DN29863_c0_g1~~TRINITY_DN29863_c0_g1_i2.p1  ORF type:complete len:347 (+),score=54.55 TRINITY_DN29863_c0_g1_i2:168-1208(+)
MLPSVENSHLSEEQPSLGSRPSFLTQLPPGLTSSSSKGKLKLPVLSKSSSAPSISSKKTSDILGKRWTTETKLFLHQRRERRWLERKNKHCYIDFSLEERAAFKSYFDALAGTDGYLSIAQIEDLFISLGIASNQKEIATIVDKVDDLRAGKLDFEQFLELIRSRTDSSIVSVFKNMMDGKLGDTNLNFQTVLSEYRRQLFIDASGARESSSARHELGAKVLQNFAELQRHRNRKPEDDEFVLEGDSSNMPKDRAFEAYGQAPLGGLKMTWRGACTEHDLLPADQPSSATKRKQERPPSPSEILHEITKNFVKPKKLTGQRSGGTVIINAPGARTDEEHSAGHQHS